MPLKGKRGGAGGGQVGEGSYNMVVTIDNVAYMAVSEVQMTMAADIPSEPTVAGFAVTDNIVNQPYSFKLTLRLYDIWDEGGHVSQTRDEQFTTLQDIWRYQRVVSLFCNFGYFESMVMESFEPKVSLDSDSAYEVDIAVKEIIVAFLLPATVQFIKDDDGTSIDVEPVDGTLVEVPLTVPETPSSEDKSIWDSIVEWFDGWWPW